MKVTCIESEDLVCLHEIKVGECFWTEETGLCIRVAFTGSLNSRRNINLSDGQERFYETSKLVKKVNAEVKWKLISNHKE